MYLQKQGMPEESELVICTITKIHFNSVFATIDEYQKQGMIHISEISPGRIRNIRDFVKEGKVIVCKVLKIDIERGHIDLSLRRVNDSQRRNKVNAMKQEQLAEKIIEFVAKDFKANSKEIYLDMLKKIEDEYEYIYPAFVEIVEENIDISIFKLEKDFSDKLLEIIKQRIKPAQVEIKGSLMLESFLSDGIHKIKAALNEAEKTSDQVDISYIGGGKYKLVVTAQTYKEAEEILKKAYSKAISEIEKVGGEGSFVRAD